MRKPSSIPHICKSESNCEICRDYVNKLDDYRQSISRGEIKNHNLILCTSMGKRHFKSKGFELPKPSLVRPDNI